MSEEKQDGSIESIDFPLTPTIHIQVPKLSSTEDRENEESILV